jgi:hypothetical protein
MSSNRGCSADHSSLRHIDKSLQSRNNSHELVLACAAALHEISIF